MESIIRKFIEQKLGDFLQVDPENVQFSPGTGRICLKQASVRSEVFDQLHLPVALRGGFVGEISANFSTSFFSSSSSAKVVVKDVFFVLGPHTSDWSWQHIYECKTKLVDLVMKVYELKGAAKKKEASEGSKGGGYFEGMKKRMVENIAKHFLGMLEVHVSNVHFRYEDAKTQSVPFACGLKIGFCDVTSSPDGGSGAPSFGGLLNAVGGALGGGAGRLPKATGDWKHSTERHADPLFSQSVATRRVSVYWDLDAEPSSLFAAKPVTGLEVKTNFHRLNLRETFSTCVVEKIMDLFPPEHRRRKSMPGPTFRERLDFHQYVVFPLSVNAHLVANRASDACINQKAPLKDADVSIERVEVAVDTGQVRSMNQLVSFMLDFVRKDKLLMSRPSEPISKYLAHMEGTRDPSSASSASAAGRGGVGASPKRPPELGEANDPQAKKRREVVRAWWLHAFEALRVLGQLSHRSRFDPEFLREKFALRDKYVRLCLEAKSEEWRQQQQEGKSTAKKAPRAEGVAHKGVADEGAKRKMREMQLQLPLPDILEWRLAALQEWKKDVPTSEKPGSKMNEVLSGGEDQHESEGNERFGLRAGAQAQPPKGGGGGAAGNAKPPMTFQVHVRLRAFDAYLLVASGHLWEAALTETRTATSASAVQKLKANGDQRRQRRARGGACRQVVVNASVSDMQVEAVQKGKSSRRVGRWVELRIGAISAENGCARERSAARQMLSVAPFEVDSTTGAPVCVFVGLTTFESKTRDFEVGDIPLGAVLEPWGGLKNHLKSYPKQETPEQLQRLGFLKNFKDEPGRLLTLAFVQAGRVQALDLKPFRSRLISLLKKGSLGEQQPAMFRRPMPSVLDREMLKRLQRKVEGMVGKSDMLGVFEGVIEGVSARLVDVYNSQHSLCKEAGLAPLQWKVLRSGNPQAVQVKLQKLVRPQDQRLQTFMGAVPRAGDDANAFGALPWKVSLGLAPKADFDIGWDFSQAAANGGGPFGTFAPPGAKPGAGASAKGRGRGHKAGPHGEAAAEATQGPLPGAWFRKWCRDGKPRWRFVEYDEGLEAIVWRSAEASGEAPRGAIPIVKIQDICTGAKTPLLKKVRHAQFQGNLAWSVVTPDRTLDLQAESGVVLHDWVTWIRVRYKQIMHIGQAASKKAPPEAGTPRSSAVAAAARGVLARTRAYPASLRPPQGELCALQTLSAKVKAVSSLGKAMMADEAAAPQPKGRQGQGPGKQPAPGATAGSVPL